MSTETLEGYTFACDFADLPPRGKKTLHLQHKTILIIVCESGLCAVEDRCPITSLPLIHGAVLNCTIQSPHTGAKYDLHSGQYLNGGQAVMQSHWLSMFPLKVVEGKVYLCLPEDVPAPPEAKHD